MKKTRQSKDVKKSSGNAAGPMDTALLEKIVALMAANDLNTVDLRDGAKRIILKRGAVALAAAPTMVSMPAPLAAPFPAAVPSAAQTAAPEDSGLKEIKSPMVGTFYSKPSPDSKAFVSVGSPVSEETDVCIIEAMKVFNNIKAECRGTIAKICVSDGQSVEFGTVLFLVKP